MQHFHKQVHPKLPEQNTQLLMSTDYRIFKSTFSQKDQQVNIFPV
jgi:hypothetical protein